MSRHVDTKTENWVLSRSVSKEQANFGQEAVGNSRETEVGKGRRGDASSHGKRDRLNGCLAVADLERHPKLCNEPPACSRMV